MRFRGRAEAGVFGDGSRLHDRAGPVRGTASAESSKRLHRPDGAGCRDKGEDSGAGRADRRARDVRMQSLEEEGPQKAFDRHAPRPHRNGQDRDGEVSCGRIAEGVGQRELPFHPHQLQRDEGGVQDIPAHRLACRVRRIRRQVRHGAFAEDFHRADSV